MVDLDALREALAHSPYLTDPDFDDYTVELNANDAVLIFAAARELLTGEKVDYCKEHKSLNASRSPACDMRAFLLSLGVSVADCRIVEALLIVDQEVP